MKTEINVGRDFSPAPAGRYADDGPFSGENFRKRFLVGAIKKNIPITVDLSGTDGYGSSFLEEAFGGLVRELGMPPHKIRTILTLVAKDPRFQSYVEEAYSYMDEASKDIDLSVGR